ncbi:MAG: TetR family transcriptional regulator [Patescibacteria group bacterium]|nr:TetR family transcriptional regulator [Patescibacteria group bacterium]
MTNGKLKILFISRAYPPVTGGLENQNYELSVWLPKIAEVKTIANTRGKKFLPFFLPYAFLKALFLCKKYDAILLGDAVLGAVGWKLKLFSRKPVVCVTHGLDLTYPMKIYQKLWVGFFAGKMDKLIAVGNETIEAGARRGIPKDKFVFIPNGVDTEKFIEFHKREELEKIVGEKLENRKIILSTGRLAVHKGIDWFCENVVPLLGEDIIYLVAGDGEKRKDIEKIIASKKLEPKVKILGKVSDEDLKVLYNTADLYVKPNIKVEGTMEGFGLVAIEAASCKLPVIASNLEGLKDAIKDGQNGFLVEPYDADGYVKKINDLLKDEAYRRDFGEEARKYVIENYSWEKISRRYLEEIQKTVSK